MNPDERLAELGYVLPEIAQFAGPVQPLLAPFVIHGGLAYLSGIGPLGTAGVVGADLTVEEGYQAAQATALLMLRRIRDGLGSLDAVERWVRVLGFVRSAPGFARQPEVINGFSQMIIDVYGADRGRCARSAIGTSELPANIPVEVEAVVALR